MARPWGYSSRFFVYDSLLKISRNGCGKALVDLGKVRV
jgi:hypothetical protein